MDRLLKIKFNSLTHYLSRKFNGVLNPDLLMRFNFFDQIYDHRKFNPKVILATLII